MARVLRVVNRNSYKSRVHQCSMCEGGRGGFSVGCLRLCFFLGGCLRIVANRIRRVGLSVFRLLLDVFTLIRYYRSIQWIVGNIE